jgi:hypothetical protein
MFKKPKEEKQKPEAKLDKDAIEKLHVDYGFRSAFMGRSEPLSWEQYDSSFCHSGGPGAYFMVPPYEGYLRLFEKYKGIIRELQERERQERSDYYSAHYGE